MRSTSSGSARSARWPGRTSRSRSGRRRVATAQATASASAASTSSSTTVTCLTRLTCAKHASITARASPGACGPSAMTTAVRPQPPSVTCTRATAGTAARRACSRPAPMATAPSSTCSGWRPGCTTCSTASSRRVRQVKVAVAACPYASYMPWNSDTRPSSTVAVASSRPSSTSSAWAGASSGTVRQRTSSTGSPSSAPATSSSSSPSCRYRHAATSSAGCRPTATAIGSRSPRSAAARARIARWWFGAMPTSARLPPSGRMRAIDQLRRPVSASRATIAPAVMYGPPSCSKKRGIGSVARSGSSSSRSWQGAASTTRGGTRRPAGRAATR